MGILYEGHAKALDGPLHDAEMGEGPPLEG